MSIEPETKDWTWVLRQECTECGENVGQLTMEAALEKLAALKEPWASALREPELANRPNDHTWSRLEYGAHVRDALQVFIQRVELMLTQEEPTFADWDQDAAAVAGRYNEENPALVLVQVQEAIDHARAVLSQIAPQDYERRGLRSDGAAFTVLTLTQYFVHDVAHHLGDVQRQR